MYRTNSGYESSSSIGSRGSRSSRRSSLGRRESLGAPPMVRERKADLGDQTITTRAFAPTTTEEKGTKHGGFLGAMTRANPLVWIAFVVLLADFVLAGILPFVGPWRDWDSVATPAACYAWDKGVTAGTPLGGCTAFDVDFFLTRCEVDCLNAPWNSEREWLHEWETNSYRTASIVAFIAQLLGLIVLLCAACAFTGWFLIASGWLMVLALILWILAIALYPIIEGFDDIENVGWGYWCNVVAIIITVLVAPCFALCVTFTKKWKIDGQFPHERVVDQQKFKQRGGPVYVSAGSREWHKAVNNHRLSPRGSRHGSRRRDAFSDDELAYSPGIIDEPEIMPVGPPSGMPIGMPPPLAHPAAAYPAPLMY